MLFKYFLGNIIYLFSYLIPKSDSIWVFGSWGGHKFADNPKYFYNYVKTNHKTITPVWLSTNKRLISDLRSKGFTIYHTHSISGIWFSSRAIVGVVSHGMVDINRYACARMNIVQTWHGIPMKPVLLSDPKPEALLKRLKLHRLKFIFPFLRKELLFSENLIICSSSSHVELLLQKVFGDTAPLRNVGFPRLDGLFSPSKANLLYKQIDELKNEGKYVGIYMPTYRREGEFDIITYLLKNLNEIEEVLSNSNIIIYLKIHPFDYFKIQDRFSSNSIRIIEDIVIQNDIYQILEGFDFLISDYSSIVFDYLILNKPLYLLVPDRSNYIASNGAFVYDYNNIDIPAVNTWNEILSLLKNKKNIDNLNDMSLRFFDNRDGKNSERLFNSVISNLYR